MRTLALLLALAALPAFAQESKESKPAPQKEERLPLNLKLDNPGSFATVAPRADPEEKQALPGLGENARPMPTQVPRSETGSVYPKDTQPGGR